MWKHAAGLLVLATLACAWLPSSGNVITANHGRDLCNPTGSMNSTKRYLPGPGKIRGVNLGSMFVFEPWLAASMWETLGCGGTSSEFDCVAHLGQAAANDAFRTHWGMWITKSDILQMQSYGLNTIRIPVGYWMKEDLVYAGREYFPQGGLAYLEKICGWASDAGFYIIIDLHGAPGAQVAQNADTGQNATSAGFYLDYQYERALQFLEWMAGMVHSNNKFRNVGMLGIVNEPIRNATAVHSMRQTYYPNAFSRIRAAEARLNIPSSNALHIQMMNSKWGSGDPTVYLGKKTFAGYDDHRYIKWDTSIPVNQSSYLSASCHDNRGGNTPTIVGEWSLSVPDNVQFTPAWHPNTTQAFYKKWFAAQVMAYERPDVLGWIFWTWKSQLGDYRWSYQDAVTAGVIPKNLDDVYNEGVCNGL